ncbi:MAG: NADH-quinone oxidoreductase subunit NuoN [Pseudomonadota bacterium]|jgi:NADH-quinone oxidoreductase subunit N|nr:NADH-quinone oxidoreductase subunit NuoN [Xanthomonadaceae bacterium]MDE2247315.1 NADH-quinone oxidoreductase subunit NuoN [Xanthomonadaceae bacterium]MDE3209812.1 NADH-quinone oxidoreductase subunit NuoN [Pseudomonadota bacterium]
MPNINDILIMLPEFYLVAAACLLLLMDAFMKPAQRPLLHWVSIIVLLVAMYLVIVGQPPQTVTAFAGMFVRDGVSEVLKVFTLGVTAMLMVYSRPYLIDRKLPIGEFYALLLFAVIGIMLLVSAGNLITIYLGLELLSLSSYALVALSRDARLTSEAAIKYFVLGALASGMLLYGMSMVYGASGMGGTPSLDLAQLHQVMAYTTAPTLLVFGMIFMLVGIGFKLGAAPFHMWIPDVYQGAPTPITAFIASASKLAAFGMAWRLLDGGMGDLSQHWQLMLAVLAVVSLAIGNLVAIVQTNLKRMLAYSTISHMGYLLLGLSAAGPEGYAASMFYAICYALMGLAAFGVMLALSRAGFECEEIADLKGLNQKAPWFAFLMLLAMFSLAGVPPLVGFWAKALVLEAAIHANMLWLALVGVVFAIIGLYYYLHVIKVMYFDKAEEGGTLVVQQDKSLRVVLSLNALLLLALGMYWGPLLDWCRHAFGL